MKPTKVALKTTKVNLKSPEINLKPTKIDLTSTADKKLTFVTSYYTNGQTKDIFELLNVKKGISINSMPSLDDYKPRHFHK
jgi:hypothetical protein